MTFNQILLNPSSVTRTLGAVAFLLVLVSIGGQLMTYLTGYDDVYGLIRLFHVDAERNIPTAFSTFLLLFAALLLAVITALKWQQTNSFVSHWAILSCGFFFMAVDEAWKIHEKFIRPVRNLLGTDDLGIFYFAWVIPGIVLVLILGLFFLKFLLRLPAKARFTFLVAASIYIGGAIGFELIGGRYAEMHGMRNLTYNMITTVEESLEMAGVIIFIRALLVYSADNYKEVRFRFEAKTTVDNR